MKRDGFSKENPVDVTKENFFYKELSHEIADGSSTDSMNNNVCTFLTDHFHTSPSALMRPWPGKMARRT